MSSILNQNYNARIYHKDPTMAEVNETLTTDSGGMSKELEFSLPALTKSAVSMVKKRKPIPDFHTKNQSFLDVYNDLKKLGVKNNKFFLMIYDKSLIGVDPYQPILPLETQLKIQFEVLINPWYWLREICRIPEDGSPIEIGGGSPFILDRNSVATWYCFLHGIPHYASKPRQCGKTQDAIAKFNYAYHYGSAASTILFFSKDAALAKTNLYRLKCQRDMMPAFMQMRVDIRDDGTVVKEVDNITTMRNPINGNTIKIMPKANSADMATRLGRGDTSSLHMFDEFDYIPYNMQIIDASVFSYSKASLNAEKNGSLHCRIFCSTPADLDSRDGKAATDFIKGTKETRGMLEWKDEYLNLPIEKFKQILNSKSYNGLVFIEHSWKQLKKSVKWYETQCRYVSYKEDVILKEIELKRIKGSSLSPFPRDVLLFLSRNIKQPIKQLDFTNNLCSIDIYEELNRKYVYILSIDTSEALGLDSNTFTLINPYTLQAAAEFKSPYISAKDFCELICTFLDLNCPKSLIVIEANKGRELINRMLDTKYAHRLYYESEKLDAKIVDKYDEYGAQKAQAINRRALGFDTTRATRPIMFQILENLMYEQKEIFITKNIVGDILNLIRKPNGRIEAAPGEHDDAIMSYLIGLCVYYNCKNLEEFGIHRGSRPPDASSKNPYDKTKKEMEEDLKAVAGILPSEYANFFKEVLSQTDSIEEVARNRQITERAEREYLQRMNLADYDEPIISEQDEDFFDNEILRSNFNGNGSINLDDLL